MKHPIQSCSVGAPGSTSGLRLGTAVRQKQRGAALLAALCFASVLAIALGSYMTLCYRTLEMSSRSLQSSQSIQLAETGMEDALWALNKNDWSSWAITGTTATKTISGFTFDGNVTGQISLTITSYNGTAGTRTVTATATTQNVAGITVTRTLTATSNSAALLVNAVAATTGVIRFASGGTVNSYDSRIGSYSDGTAGYSAILSSGSTSTSASTVQLTNAQVKGYVATLSTGPSYSTSARLYGPATPVTTKIDTDRQSTSPYQPIFDELAPSGAGTTLANASSTIGTPGATSSSIYYTSGLTLNGNQIITVSGPVAIAVTGNLSISNNAKILVAAGGSLELHVTGTISIGGNGIENATELPKNVVLISSSSPDTAAMSTTTPFHGIIYTPNTSFTITESQTIYGAMVVKSATFSGSPVFHYDIALRDNVVPGVTTPYAVSDWRETTAGN
jgi:hypothetical protein